MKKYIRNGKIYTEEDLKYRLRTINLNPEFVSKFGYIEIKNGNEEEYSEAQDSEYDNLVNTLIRRKYTASKEFSILRKRDSVLGQAEYLDYFEYCEECKLEAQQIMNLEAAKREREAAELEYLKSMEAAAKEKLEDRLAESKLEE